MSSAFKGRTWEEQRIRDRLAKDASDDLELEILLAEIDRLRTGLLRIKVIADDKFAQQVEGWGAWRTVQRIVEETK